MEKLLGNLFLVVFHGLDSGIRNSLLNNYFKMAHIMHAVWKKVKLMVFGLILNIYSLLVTQSN